MTGDEEADLEAIERVLAGELSAFEELVIRYERPLRSMIQHLTGNHETTRDVAQDAFVAAFRHLGRFDPSRSLFPTWLYAIARHRCLNLRRKSRREVGEPMTGADAMTESPSDEAIRRESFARLDAALDRLPEPLRRVFVLAELDGLPYEQIAQLEGVRPGTVKSRVSRARARLREGLATNSTQKL